MAKPIKIWTGTEWVEIATAAPSTAGLATTSALAAHEADTTNIHGIADTANLMNKTILDAKGDLITATANDTPATLSVGSNGHVLVADSSQSTGLRYRAPFMSNHIINGGFDVWQRGTSGTTTSNIGFPSADRWNAWTLAAGGSVTLSRQTVSDSTNLPNARYCGRFQRVSGNTNTGTLVLGQALETSTSIQMAGQSVTLSFWIRTGANFSATSMSGQVWSNTTTDSGLNTVQNGSSVLANVNVTPSSTWTRYTATGTVSTSATQIAVAFAYTPTGTAGASDWFEITGVQLETGPVATPFEFEPYETTLRKCQRYYQRIVPGAAGRYFGHGQSYSTTQTEVVIPYKIVMRTNPTALEQNGTATDYRVGTAGGSSTALSTVPTLVNSTDNSITVLATVASGQVAGNATPLIAWSTTAYLGWSAEL